MRFLLVSLLLTASLSVAGAQPSVFADLSAASESDRAFATSLGADPSQASHVRETFALKPTPGLTSLGYVLKDGPQGPTLSNGTPYSRSLHGAITQAPGREGIQGEGVRIVTGQGSVERLQFQSAADARDYALRGLNLTTGPASRLMSVDLRGETLLVVTGALATNAEALSQIRELAYRGDPRRPDLLATLGEGAIVLESRIDDAELNAAIDRTQEAMARYPKTQNPRPGLWVIDDGNRSVLEEAPDGLRSVTFASPERRALVDSLAESYRRDMTRSPSAPAVPRRPNNETASAALRNLRNLMRSARSGPVSGGSVGTTPPAPRPVGTPGGVFVTPSGAQEPVFRDSSGRLVFANGQPLTAAERLRVQP